MGHHRPRRGGLRRRRSRMVGREGRHRAARGTATGARVGHRLPAAATAFRSAPCRPGGHRTRCRPGGPTLVVGSPARSRRAPPSPAGRCCARHRPGQRAPRAVERARAGRAGGGVERRVRHHCPPPNRRPAGRLRSRRLAVRARCGPRRGAVGRVRRQGPRRPQRCSCSDRGSARAVAGQGDRRPPRRGFLRPRPRRAPQRHGQGAGAPLRRRHQRRHGDLRPERVGATRRRPPPRRSGW